MAAKGFDDTSVDFGSASAKQRVPAILGAAARPGS
jgi:hypothetical protein